MTKHQVIWLTLGYLGALLAAIYFTRATLRRVIGALLGGAVVGVMLMGVIVLGNRVAWWQVPLASTPSSLTLFYVGAVISCSPIYLLTWRVARRFGWRGLTLCFLAAAIIGPPRDYLIATMYPNWMAFTPGITPMLAVSATYVGLVAVGHGVMSLIATPSQQDRLAQRPWGAA